jgi:hypothetical protein
LGSFRRLDATLRGACDAPRHRLLPVRAAGSHDRRTVFGRGCHYLPVGYRCIGTGGTPRAGVALTWTADSFGWDSLSIFGDSGSPVRVTNLAAAGDLTHLVVDTNWLPSFVAGTRMSKIASIAGGWALASSSLCL